MTTIYVVRHAKAGDRDRWEGDDRVRPLTKRGRKQADGLVDQLAGVDIGRVLSSPYLRCTQTVEPLAQARRLALENHDALAEGAALSQLHALLRSLARTPAVLCTHGDIVANLISCLAETGTPGVDELRWKKGSTWALTMSDDIISSASYRPPPP